jgi:hypothetical protein
VIACGCSWSLPHRLHPPFLFCCCRFATPLIHDIIAAVIRADGNTKKAVANLQRDFPRLATESEARFASLSESTVRTWFDKTPHQTRLLPRYAQLIASDQLAAPRGPGGRPTRVLDSHPDVEAEIKRVLTKMRAEAGAVVNIAVIRWVMRAVIQEMHPPLLMELKLSSGFISTWARSQMNWTWRCRTGAASKLPEDWMQQGVIMAQRIAVNMELYSVSSSA